MYGRLHNYFTFNDDKLIIDLFKKHHYNWENIYIEYNENRNI